MLFKSYKGGVASLPAVGSSLQQTTYAAQTLLHCRAQVAGSQTFRTLSGFAQGYSDLIARDVLAWDRE